jgi:putative ABC transport system ATP-binding protein
LLLGSRVSETSAIILRDVRKSYRSGDRDIVALDGINLTVDSGEFVCVVGPAGAGKSTVLDVMAGLEVPEEGRVEVSGQDLSLLSDDDRSDLRMRDIGFVFETCHLYPTFTVEENVTWSLEFLGVDWRAARHRAAAALDAVLLDPAARSRRPAQLTADEQQRVAIARAISKRPEILLCDEPTGALDAPTGRRVLEALARVNRELGTTTAIITHNAPIARMADRVIALADGVIASEKRNETKAPPSEIEW